MSEVSTGAVSTVEAAQISSPSAGAANGPDRSYPVAPSSWETLHSLLPTPSICSTPEKQTALKDLGEIVEARPPTLTTKLLDRLTRLLTTLADRNLALHNLRIAFPFLKRAKKKQKEKFKEPPVSASSSTVSGEEDSAPASAPSPAPALPQRVTATRIEEADAAPGAEVSRPFVLTDSPGSPPRQPPTSKKRPTASKPHPGVPLIDLESTASDTARTKVSVSPDILAAVGVPRLRLEQGKSAVAMTVAFGELVLVIDKCLYRADFRLRQVRFWAGPLPMFENCTGSLVFDEETDSFYACDDRRLVKFTRLCPTVILPIMTGAIRSCAIDKVRRLLYYSLGDKIYVSGLHLVAPKEFHVPAVTFKPPANNLLSLTTLPDGTLFASDALRHSVWKFTPDGKKSIVGGSGDLVLAGYSDGPALSARFNSPMGISGVGDAAGCMLFVCDTGNNRIRVITQGQVITMSDLDSSEPMDIPRPTMVATTECIVFYSAFPTPEIGFYTPCSSSRPLPSASLFTTSPSAIEIASLQRTVLRSAECDDTVEISNDQASVRLLSTFLRLKCPPLFQNPKLPSWVTQEILELFAVSLASDRKQKVETSELVSLALLASIYNLPGLEFRVMYELDGRLHWMVDDCNQVAYLLFTLIKTDPLLYQRPVAKVLRTHFIYAYYRSRPTSRPPASQVIDAFGPVEPGFLDAHLLPNSTTVSPDRIPCPIVVEMSNESLLQTLYTSREETADFSIVSAPDNADPAHASAKYRFHSFVFRHFWPYFAEMVASAMREASDREANFSLPFPDGGLTLPALEAIGQLFYTGSLTESMQKQLAPLDMLSFSANIGLYGFDKIPRLKPLLQLACQIDKSRCVEYYQLATELKLDSFVQYAEKFIVQNFHDVWTVSSNRERLLTFSDQKSKELVFSLLSQLSRSIRSNK